jgi:hypothetical protein
MTRILVVELSIPLSTNCVLDCNSEFSRHLQRNTGQAPPFHTVKHLTSNDLGSSPTIIRVIKIEKNEMGGACNTYGAEERRIQGIGGKT